VPISGIYDSYEVYDDCLVVTLCVGNNDYQRIRCKNTSVKDYEGLVENIKNLRYGNMITYTAKSTGVFGGERFHKVERDYIRELEIRILLDRSLGIFK
jgi:DNA polymerase II small subunit/DNA polymerase delta subunit B